MSIEVVEAGVQATVQDRGRPGYYSAGIPPSGAQDQYAYRIGNKLIGNSDNDAALELTALGGTYEFSEDTVIAVTGANFRPKLNGNTVSMWEAVAVQTGDVLEFTKPPSDGYRTYLCVSGGIDVPNVLDSRSTYLTGAMGGYNGRALKAGDVLNQGQSTTDESIVGNRLSNDAIPEYGDEKTLRFIFGCEDYCYTEESKQDFLDWEWRANSTSDRVAYRFDVVDGGSMNFIEREAPYGAGDDPSNVVDSPYPIGSVHVPSGTEPILLINDGVSAGGYATLGTVTTVDLNLVGQIKPGDIIQFQETSAENAVSIRREWKRDLANAEIVRS